jgi:polar amino acid transport system substrate-binding protein
MKKYFKLGMVVLAVLAMTLVAVGCGGGEKPATDNAAPAGDKQEKLVVAFEPTFAPFESTDEKGEFVGFDIDLIKAVAEAEGLEIELKSLGFDGLIPALGTGQIDVIISGMSITPERIEKVNFSIPYYDAGLGIVVQQSNNEINKFEDLAGKKLAAQIGTTGANKANEAAEELKATVKNFNTNDLVFMELMNGAADAVITDLPVAKDFIAKKGEGKVKIVEELDGESYGIAVAKGNDELVETINAGLLKVKESGQYGEIYKKWFDTEAPDYLPGEVK